MTIEPPEDSAVAEAVERIFADFAGQLRTELPARRDALWATLAEAGLTAACIPEELGGAGATLLDGFAVIAASGRFATDLPVAETLLGAWLLAQGGIAFPGGKMALAAAPAGGEAVLDGNGRVRGVFRNVPFAHEADHLALVFRSQNGLQVAMFPAGSYGCESRQNIGADARCRVTIDVRPARVARLPADWNAGAPMLMGALARSVQMAGLLETLLERTVAYASERVAFGRPIASYQAIQHNLARLAGEAAVAMSSSRSALASVSQEGLGASSAALEVMAAKIRCGEAVTEAASIAHQVHGAIGFTSEFFLSRFTRRAWGWRDDFGTETWWSVQLGEYVAGLGADELWPMLASR